MKERRVHVELELYLFVIVVRLYIPGENLRLDEVAYLKYFVPYFRFRGNL